MSFLREFKEFATKGNIVDLAVAVIIGTAFSAIISSLVDDVITPLLLTPALQAMNAEDIGQLSWRGVKYGNFISAVIKFMMVALVLFMIIKGLNRFSRKKEAAPVLPSSTDQLLMEIRDELKRR